jgi:uncharacterized protein (DUF362 family)
MSAGLSRRQFLVGSTAAAALAGRLVPFARALPAAPVSVARCDSYGPELVPTLDRMFDQIGGLGRLVKGRTVAIKINLTGSPLHRLRNRPHELAQWVHPRVIGAVAHLMDRAGARRIRVLECVYGSTGPLEEYVYQAGWDPDLILGASPRVELVNTNWLGHAREYHRFDVPGKGLLFPSFLLNHAYSECDTFVSLTKLKDHSSAGITLSMKNCFGNLPTTVYGGDVPEDEPLEVSMSGRGEVFHQGARQPCRIAAPEIDPTSPRHEGYRIPRVVVDICRARPIDLAVIDGISSMGGSEGPWAGGEGCEPKVLVTGTNCVNTDAVAAAVMGYDPRAGQGTLPFDLCDNHIDLAARVGLGTNDTGKIEVAGLSIAEARFDFGPMVRSRYPRSVPPYPSTEE